MATKGRNSKDWLVADAENPKLFQMYKPFYPDQNGSLEVIKYGGKRVKKHQDCAPAIVNELFASESEFPDQIQFSFSFDNKGGDSLG